MLLCPNALLAVHAFAIQLTITLSVLLGLCALFVGAALARRRRQARTRRTVNFCGLKLDSPGLCANTMFTGEVGSGMVGLGMGPALETLFARVRCHDLEMGGGLVLADSALICQRVELLAEGIGRPVVRITPGSGETGFNLVAADASPPEVAANLWSLACGKEVGKVAYMRRAAEGFLCACLEILRQAHPDREITIKDLLAAVRFPESLRSAAGEFPLGTVGRIALESGRLDLDAGTHAMLVTAMTNAFAHFFVDPSLSATFCTPTNIDFRECSTQGKFFILNFDYRFAMSREIVGKALLQRFLRAAATRVTDASDHPKPPLLLVMDETQRYVTGTPEEAVAFATSRSMRLITMASLVSEAWLSSAIGPSSAGTLLAQFSNWVWFVNHDNATRNRARAMLGSKAPDLASLAPGEKASYGLGASPHLSDCQ